MKLKSRNIINESDIENAFKSIYTTIIANIQKSLGKGSGGVIDLVIDHTFSTLKYNPLAGSSYIKWSKELVHPKNWLMFKILIIMNALNGVWSDT